MIKYLSKTKPSLLKGKTVLLRLDFNTQDEWRLQASLSTIRFLLKHKTKIVIISHKGRPKGFDRRLSLKPNSKVLERFLRRKVIFIPHFQFDRINKTIKASSPGSIFLLENIRFTKGEETVRPELARALASLADLYVNDAFAVEHRSGDSITRIEHFLPGFAGLELEREIVYLSHVMKRSKKPLVVILGGGKAHDKLGVLKYFRRRAAWFLLGGAAANTLLLLHRFDVGDSLVDQDAKDLRALQSALSYKNIILPVDWCVSGNRILAIGPKSIKLYKEKIATAKTIIWSGSLGFIEKTAYAKGDLAIARAITRNKKAFSIAGGGETVMFLKKHRLDKKFSFISTGGGAMLDFLAGEKLPGIEALKRSRQ